MMMEKVAEFHVKFGHPVAEQFTPLSPSRASLRIDLIKEELQEFKEATNLVEVADALGDLLYVVFGCALEVGVSFNTNAEDFYQACIETDIIVDQKPEYVDEVFKRFCYNIMEAATERVEQALQGSYDAEDAESAEQEMLESMESLYQMIMLSTIRYGLFIEEIFNEIHDSNMSKLGEDGKPIYRSDGKVLKGPNYFKPKLTPLVMKQVAEYEDRVYK